MVPDGLPWRPAGRIVDGLPARLARDLGGQTTWRVEHETQSLPLDEEGNIPMLALAEERRAEHGRSCFRVLSGSRSVSVLDGSIARR